MTALVVVLGAVATALVRMVSGLLRALASLIGVVAVVVIAATLLGVDVPALVHGFHMPALPPLPALPTFPTRP